MKFILFTNVLELFLHQFYLFLDLSVLSTQSVPRTGRVSTRSVLTLAPDLADPMPTVQSTTTSQFAVVGQAIPATRSASAVMKSPQPQCEQLNLLILVILHRAELMPTVGHANVLALVHVYLDILVIHTLPAGRNVSSTMTVLQTELV